MLHKLSYTTYRQRWWCRCCRHCCHHHHHRLNSPVWALAFSKSFFHSYLVSCSSNFSPLETWYSGPYYPPNSVYVNTFSFLHIVTSNQWKKHKPTFQIYFQFWKSESFWLSKPSTEDMYSNLSKLITSHK